MKKIQLKKFNIPFIYFVLIAPILAKLLEWTVQLSLWGKDTFLLTIFSSGTWFLQLLFIESIAFVTYFFFFIKDKTKAKNLLFIPAIAYLLKEVFNFSLRNIINGDPITLGYVQVIALTIEPLVVLLLLGFLPYKIFFKKK